MELQSNYPTVGVTKAPLLRNLTLGRLNQFISSNFPGITSILDIKRQKVPISNIEVYHSHGRDRILFNEAIKQKFVPYNGDDYGPSWTQHWFRVHIDVPEYKEGLKFEFDPSCEALIYDSEGRTLQGITGGFGIDRRVDMEINPAWCGTRVKLYIAVSCNGMFGNGLGETNNPPDNDRYFSLATVDIVVPRLEAWHLLWDMITIRDLASQLGDRSPLGNLCLSTGNEICNIFRINDLSSIARARKVAEKVYGKDWMKPGADVYKAEHDARVFAIGNCHIDTCWLWTFKQTRDKTARSWTAQLALAKKFPEYRFLLSQVQQIAWLEEDFPELIGEIKTAVEKGQFLLAAGSWVEFDCNLPSGEALCRQFLYGQRYLISRFGEASISKTFWLPDSFGFNPAMPQICRLAGYDSFFTQKTSWSAVNTFPLTTYNWIGIDGTQVLTHHTPCETYTAQASVADLLNAVNKHKDLATIPTSILAFGNGDGGGGPLVDMLENLRRCRAVSTLHGELPKVHSGSTLEDFYQDVLQKTDNGKDLASWKGELYLELHRGTATSHGAVKLGNRKSEILLREVEYACTLASIGLSQTGQISDYIYPKSEIDKLWKNVLLCQFHDLLPGSSIELVYEDAAKIYAEIKETGYRLLSDAFNALVPSPSTGQGLITTINTTLLSRRDLFKVPVQTIKSLDSEFLVQVCDDGEAYVLMEHLDGGFLAQPTQLIVTQGDAQAEAKMVNNSDEYHLSNDHLDITINDKGRITSIIDRDLEREIVLEGKTCGFVIFEDKPLNWDAWDLDQYHLFSREEVNSSKIEIIESGPLRATLLVTYHVGQSTIQCYMSLDSYSPIPKENELAPIRFETRVDWHERHRILKFEAPVAIMADTATFEIQFGFKSMPTHRNTTWDQAKFEVVGHKYADISEWGYGVALINDCKYGYSCAGSTLALSLLRAPTVPDATTDQGLHRISFALAPHRGTFAESEVPKLAILFNNPVHTRFLATPHEVRSTYPEVFSLKGDRNIILETIKRGEDDHFGVKNGRKDTLAKKNIILRFYEAYGGQGVANLISRLDIESVQVVDILEREVVDFTPLEIVKKLNLDDEHTSSIKIKLSPFQILTLKVTLE